MTDRAIQAQKLEFLISACFEPGPLVAAGLMLGGGGALWARFIGRLYISGFTAQTRFVPSDGHILSFPIRVSFVPTSLKMNPFLSYREKMINHSLHISLIFALMKCFNLSIH